MRTSELCSLTLTDTSVRGLVRWLVNPDPARIEPRAAAYLNAHTMNLALRQGSELGPLLLEMDLLYPDGMSVVREARRRGFPVSERVSAADFFLPFCRYAAKKKRSIALIGGTTELVESCAQFLTKKTPGLNICYTHHGYLPEGGAEMQQVQSRLRDLRPAITLVGMGSPQQERFALSLRNSLGLPTVWCVGALFEYYAPGYRRHAPRWMRKNGLEWLFRLSQEPRRLAGRYLLGNIEFLLRMRGII